MDTFQEYLSTIENLEHRARMMEIFEWIAEKYSKLVPKIAWNQPMYTDHGTFIIAFSIAQKHLAIAPEKVAIQYFEKDIKDAGYDHSKELIRVKWKQGMNYDLLEKIIDYNIREKAECETFWRK